MPRALRSGQSSFSSVGHTHYRWPTLSTARLSLLIHLLTSIIAVCRIMREFTVRVTGTWLKGKTMWYRSDAPPCLRDGVRCYSQQSLREPGFTQSGKEEGDCVGKRQLRVTLTVSLTRPRLTVIVTFPLRQCLSRQPLLS